MEKQLQKSPKISKATLSHIRSNSFPSTSNPLNSSVTQTLLPKLITILKAGSSSSSICQKLHDFKDLYEGIQNSIQCPLIQQALSLELHREDIEEVLDGSLKLLEFCGSTNDVLTSMKESILELESCLCRRNGGQEKNINAYFMSRKKIQKIANKHLKTLQATIINSRKGENNGGIIHIVRMLQVVERLIFSTLESILGSFCRPKGNVWSLSKLTNSKVSCCKKQVDVYEFVAKMDEMIFDLESKKTNMDAIMAHDLINQLGSLKVVISEIEGCLENISRCLIKTRVSLLNILSQ